MRASKQAGLFGGLVLGVALCLPCGAEEAGLSEASEAGPAASEQGERSEALAEAHRLHEQGRLEAAHEAFTELAEAGNAEAKVQLGWMYLEGHATEPDMERAAELWQEAADAGHERAEHLLNAVLPGLEAQ